jgi:L-histidine Nalpha-methyltransferase
MSSPRLFPLHRPDSRALASEAAAGLLARPARVAPKFFYDDLGSRLFDVITALPEYYPTRTEASIMAGHAADIAGAALRVTGERPTLVDLGAGDGAKAERLFGLLRPRRYVAVDISLDFLEQALQAMQSRHPDVALDGVGLDFSARLALPPEVIGPDQGPLLVYYPGSSIGNFAPAAALRLLTEARALGAGGALLIGVDLIKDRATLEAAYDDELGVTAAFNLNLLRHLNRLLGADFDLRGWRHRARFDAEAGCVRMHLIAREPQTVRWPGAERAFDGGEAIHTEDSYKWRPAVFEALLNQAGYAHTRQWSDAEGRFGVFLAWG